jgi:hypothetical protein
MNLRILFTDYVTSLGGTFLRRSEAAHTRYSLVIKPPIAIMKKPERACEPDPLTPPEATSATIDLRGSVTGDHS